jgi:hypothetical protein
MNKTYYRIIIAGAVLYGFQSCSVIRTVEVAGATWNCAGSGQTFCYEKVVKTSIWKGKNNDKIAADCPNGLSRVKITTKPLDVLVGTLSLGFVVRQRIQWDCSQRTGSDDMR